MPTREQYQAERTRLDGMDDLERAQEFAKKGGDRIAALSSAVAKTEGTGSHVFQETHSLIGSFLNIYQILQRVRAMGADHDKYVYQRENLELHRAGIYVSGGPRW